MFEGLTGRLGDIFTKLRGRGALTEEDVVAALREVRIALLEADVALPVVKDFIAKVRERAVGQEVLRSITPGQQVIKIVHDCLVEMLGAANESLNLTAVPPVPILMVGLQGSGKTTTTGKIAKRLVERERKRVLMASLDVNRPAAQEQLRILGEQAKVPTLPIIAGQTPVEIAIRAIQTARAEGYDVVMLDTAGRLAIDEALMLEVAAIRDATRPVETLLVADAMTGQDAVNVAKAFDERVGLTGIVLTRIDGDSRGGAALSMRAVTGKPIKLLGVGERLDAIEPFHPDRLAGRMLGMGDVVSLVERAAETIDRDEAEKLARKLEKGGFDLDDFASQLRQMKKMGGMGGIMGMLPGVGKLQKQLEGANIDDRMLSRQEAIISSMTKAERRNTKLLNASRRRRIAMGSGTDVADVNRLLKQFLQMQEMMKKMQKMGKKGFMRSLAGKLPPGMMPPGGMR
jgi:signal recognition particle subunit SRP54